MMKIHVRTITGKTITLDVARTTTLPEVKDKIHKKEGIPVESQRLLANGRQLVDTRLEDCPRDLAFTEKLSTLDLSRLGSRLLRKMASLPLHCRDHSTSSKRHIRRVLQEYRRFLELKLALNDKGGGDDSVDEIDHGMLLAPPDPIDEAWRAHIVDTRRYATACRHVAGELIHHDPDEDDDDEAAEEEDGAAAPASKKMRSAGGGRITTKQLRVTRTVAAYRSRFGHAPPEDIWRFGSSQPAAIPPAGAAASFASTGAGSNNDSNNNNGEDSDGYGETMEMGGYGQQSEELSLRVPNEDGGDTDTGGGGLDLSAYGLHASHAGGGYWELHGALHRQAIGQVVTNHALTLQDYSIQPEAELELVLGPP